MNEIIAGSRLHCTHRKDGDFQKHVIMDSEDGNHDHQRLSFRSVHTTETSYTGTTPPSQSDASGSKSSSVLDHRQRNHASGMKWFKKSSCSPSPTSSKESNSEHHGPHLRRHTTVRRKIGRKLLAGMIAKVMMSAVGENHSLDGTDKERSGDCDSMCRIEQSGNVSQCKGIQQAGVGLPTTPPFCDTPNVESRDKKIEASSIHPTTLCKTSSESCDSVITEEVIFEQDIPSIPVLDHSHEVSSVGSKKKSLIRASSDTTGDDTKGDASVKRKLPPRRASSSFDLHFSLEAQRDLVPRLPPRQRSFEKLVSPVREEKEQVRPSGEIIGAPLSDAFCPARRNTAHSTSTRSSCTSSGTILSGEQIHAYVMSHMPDFVQKQLPEEEWRRIFSAAAAVQESPLTFAVTVSGSVDNGQDASQKEDHRSKDGRLTDDDDVSSVVSCLTAPFSVGEFKEESDRVPRRKAETSVAPALTNSKRSAGKSRSWHEGSSTHESAPRIPKRCGQKGEPEAQLPNARAFPKQTLDLEPSSFRNVTPRAANSKRAQRVVFANVHVRYYERILDVNPSTRSGPSVGIGWKYKDMRPIKLDCVKDKRTEYRDLVLSRPEREKMLYDLGYSKGDLAKAVRLNLKLKNQRAQTYNNLRHEKVEYLVEKSRRKVGQLLRSFGAGKKD